MTNYISVKLPETVVTLFLPEITTTAQTIISVEDRVTPEGETRVIPEGNTRVVNYDITCYPEIVGRKINNTVLNVSVPL